jgi:hypothetical protein
MNKLRGYSYIQRKLRENEHYKLEAELREANTVEIRPSALYTYISMAEHYWRTVHEINLSNYRFFVN